MPKAPTKKSKPLFKAGIGFAVLMAILSLPIYLPYLIDSFNIVHSPPTECSAFEGNEAFCEQRYFDDGLIRFSGSPSERGNYCILELRINSDNAGSYRLLACDRRDGNPMSCGAVESYGVSKLGH